MVLDVVHHALVQVIHLQGVGEIQDVQVGASHYPYIPLSKMIMLSQNICSHVRCPTKVLWVPYE